MRRTSRLVPANPHRPRAFLTLFAHTKRHSSFARERPIEYRGDEKTARRRGGARMTGAIGVADSSAKIRG